MTSTTWLEINRLIDAGWICVYLKYARMYILAGPKGEMKTFRFSD